MAGRIKKYTITQNLATAGVNVSYSPGTQYILRAIYIHLSGNSSDTFTVTLDNSEGANFDTVLTSQTLNAAANAVLTYGDNYILLAEDNIKITSTNAASVAAYITIVTEEA